MPSLIPKTIHYCWFGHGPLSDLNKRCIDSWSRVMPEFEIKLWNEDNTELDNDYLRAAHGRGEWSKVTNYVRMRALDAEGGLYLDTDVEALKSFTPLLVEECFLGFQCQAPAVEWAAVGVIGSVRSHPFLKASMIRIEQYFRDTGKFQIGPAAASDVLRENGLRIYGYQKVMGVRIYPTEYFYPYPWDGEFSPDCITPNTYCVHHWEGTWIKTPSKARSALRTIKRAAKRLLFP